MFTIEIKRTELRTQQSGPEQCTRSIHWTVDTLLSLLSSMEKKKKEKKRTRAFIPHLISIGHLTAMEHDRFHIVCVSVAFIEHFRSHAERFLCELELFLLFGVDSVFYCGCYCEVNSGWRRIGESAFTHTKSPTSSFFFGFGFIRNRISFFRLLLLRAVSYGIRFTILVTTSIPVSSVVLL